MSRVCYWAYHLCELLGINSPWTSKTCTECTSKLSSWGRAGERIYGLPSPMRQRLLPGCSFLLPPMFVHPSNPLSRFLPAGVLYNNREMGCGGTESEKHLMWLRLQIMSSSTMHSTSELCTTASVGLGCFPNLGWRPSSQWGILCLLGHWLLNLLAHPWHERNQEPPQWIPWGSRYASSCCVGHTSVFLTWPLLGGRLHSNTWATCGHRSLS